MPTSSPLGAPSRGVVWRNMAPIRPTHTARLCPLNTRLPESSIVKYVFSAVDTVVVAPRPCGAAMRGSVAASHCSRVTDLLQGSSRYEYTSYRQHVQIYRHERETGRGQQWMENSKATQLSIPLTPSYTSQSSNVFSNQQRWGAGYRLSVSLPSPKTRTALNAQADGTGRARHISQTRCNCKCLSLAQTDTHVHNCAHACMCTGRKRSKEIIQGAQSGPEMQNLPRELAPFQHHWQHQGP